MQTVFSQYGDPGDSSMPSFARPSRPRRRRDAPACAECRRLKLKCDRASPCGTCVRRGCAAICPDGFNSKSASQDSMLARIDALNQRVRALEVALEAESARGAAHPLLSTDLRSLPDRPLPEHGHPPPTPSYKAASEGDVRKLVELAATFPQPLEEDELINVERTISDIRALLPPQNEARALTQSFYDGFGNTWSAIKRPTFERMLEEIYSGSPQTDLEGVHTLALVFLAFALARYRADTESDIFFYLAKALFCIRSCVESTSLVTIHGLLLVTTYCRLTGRTSATWTTFGIIGKLVVANNLHRDPARWGIDGTRAAYWRATFWEIYSVETLYTMTVQRVPTFHPAYVDCPMPDLELDSSDPVTRVNAHYAWKYRFAGEVLPRVLQDTLGRTQPTYNTILDLDRLVRASWVPECLEPDRSNPIDDGGPPGAAMQRFIILWYRELTLLFLHRTPLAIALTESFWAGHSGAEGEALVHRFAPSVLAAFRSAYKLTSALRTLATASLHKNRGGRENLHAQHVCFWQAGFVATTVLASLAMRAPGSSFGHAAREEALLVTELYATRMVHVPQKILTWLSQLKGKLLDVAVSVGREDAQGAPEWDQFGADEVPLGGLARARTRALGHLASKTAHIQAPTNEVSSGTDTSVAEFTFAFDTQGPINERSDLAELPIEFDYFPPQPGAIMPESQIVDWADIQSYFPSAFAAAAGEELSDKDALGSAPQEAELTSQWERFLHSIGLSADELARAGGQGI